MFSVHVCMKYSRVYRHLPLVGSLALEGQLNGSGQKCCPAILASQFTFWPRLHALNLQIRVDNNCWIYAANTYVHTTIPIKSCRRSHKSRQLKRNFPLIWERGRGRGRKINKTDLRMGRMGLRPPYKKDLGPEIYDFSLWILTTKIITTNNNISWT